MVQKTKKLSMFSLIVYNLTGGRIQMNNAADSVGLLELITTGRKSGQSRKVSLVFIKSDSAYAVAGSNAGRDRHPGWYFNLRSNPQVMMRINGQQIKAIAEPVGSEQRKLLWKQLVEAAPMFARYEKSTSREIPMVLLHPVDEG